MSNFLPEVGTLFYAECQRYITTGGDPFGAVLGIATATVEKVRDRSYSDAIFRMRAHDDRMIVADRVCDYGVVRPSGAVTLQRRDYHFLPVGPDVAAALGLSLTPDAAAESSEHFVSAIKPPRDC